MSSTDEQNAVTLNLSRVARIQPGYLSRSAVRPAPGGTHRLLQAKDVSPDAGVRTDGTVRFHPERNPDLYRVSRGDILVTARGRDHQAYLIAEDLDDTLASNVFYIVRSCTDRIVPAYLAWWLNLPQVQAQIEAGSRGTGIGYISRQTIEQLPVVVPALEAQERIAGAIDLWRQKKLLQTRLDEKRELLIQAVCRRTIRQREE